MNLKQLLRVLVCTGLGLFLLPVPLYALDPSRTVYQYNCRTWTRQAGLPVNAIRDIAQTKDGYLWLATEMGLRRFDGMSFESIKLPERPQFRRGPIAHLAGAAKGGLWFSIEGGAFGFYDGGVFRSMEQHAWVSPAMGVGAMIEGADGWLWVAPGSGVARCQGATTNEDVYFRYPIEVSTLCEDVQHRVWLGTADEGLFYWQAGEIHPFPDAGLKNKGIFAVAVDEHGRIWVGTQAGVQCYDSNFARHDLVQTTTDVKALLADRHGVVWIGRRVPKVTVTREGVSLCQKGVTRWPLSWLTVCLLRSELKRAGGRAASLSSRPPAGEGS